MMTRIGQLTATLLAALVFVTAAAADAAGQPPRRTRYPDAAQNAKEPRFALAAHAGARWLDVTSQLFTDNETDFGITPQDFLSDRFGVELAVRVLPRLDLSLGWESGEAGTDASYLNFVYEDGREIEHSARLGMGELTLGLRFHLLDHAARFNPYLIAGGSGAFYRYSEVGDFVNFDTADIYYDEYQEELFLPGFFAGAGADFAVFRFPSGGRADVFAEFRYARSQGTHEAGFDGFGDLTLGRLGGIFGFRVRF